MPLEEATKIIDLVSKFLMPLVVAVFGVLLLRRVEGIKTRVGRQSEFVKRRADAFFDNSQRFMEAIERYASLLFQIALLAKQGHANGELGRECQEECNRLNVAVGEPGYRLKRTAAFAPSNGERVLRAAENIQSYLIEMYANRQGDFDHLMSLQNVFNEAARDAHAEILKVA